MTRRLLILGLALLACGCWRATEKTDTWVAMGETARATVHAVTEADADESLRRIRDAVARAEFLMTDGSGGDALDRLNVEAANGYHSVDDRDLYRCVLLALDYAKASDGAFDPTVGPLLRLYDGRDAVPDRGQLERTLDRVGWQKVAIATEVRGFRFRVSGMELDLGGIVKGFALDMAARAFARPGVRGGLIGLGGNVYAWGKPEEGGEWTVALPDPRRPDATIVEIRTHNRGLAVSGHRAPVPGLAAGRPRPILDAGTGEPSASDVLAAIAVADSGADADAFATALFVAGSMRGADLLSRANRVEAVLVVRRDGGPPEVLASASLRGRFELSPELAAETAGTVRYLLPPQDLEPI